LSSLRPSDGGSDHPAGAGQPPGAAGTESDRNQPPEGIRTTSSPSPSVTRLVLVRHGEAVCNVAGVCGGRLGCSGLTERGVHQVELLRDRLAVTGELAGTDALYASVLPRAIQTAEILAPSLVAGDADPLPVLDGEGPGLSVTSDCGLCELHPGQADGLSWAQFTERFGQLDWDRDPDQIIAPGGESWTGFVNRAADTLEAIAARHRGQLVVVACHAGVIEASLLALMPVAGGRQGARLQLRTHHASLTSWEVDEGRWRLLGYNDGAHLVSGVLAGAPGLRALGTQPVGA
jgi:probable phosphoglycerate mutase